MTTRVDDALTQGPDPAAIRTRDELAAALTALREQTGLSVRAVAGISGVPQGTIAGWSSGQHVPTKASLGMFTAVLVACGVVAESAHQAWHEAIARARQDHGPRSSSTASPYRGLEAFQEADAAWFFGRETLTEQLVARVRHAAEQGTPRVVTVIGPSGSGKSSLLRAGLVAKVNSGELSPKLSSAIVITPGAQPVAALDAILDHAGTERRVLVVDQCEELWTLCADADLRAQFLHAIVDLPEHLVVVLGLRADFYASAASEPTLVPVLAAGPLVVGPMAKDELRSIITAPATKAGTVVEDALVELLMHDIDPRPAMSAGSLPLLSHALLSTWTRAQARWPQGRSPRGAGELQRSLTAADYGATGGIGGAVQQSAEVAFGELTPRQQVAARRIFLRLISVAEDSEAKRRARRTELSVGDDEDVRTVVNQFARRRLLTVDAEFVEVSHEALLRAWGRLREWVDADRAGLILQRQLVQAAQLWQDSGRETGALLSGSRLTVLGEWVETGDHHADLTELERAFLAASTAHAAEQEQRDRRRVTVLRWLVSGLAVLFVVAMVAATTAMVARTSANQQRTAAEHARDEATSRQVATASVGMRDKDPALSAQLALAAFRVSPTLEARSALLDSTASHTPSRVLGPGGGTVSAVSADGSLLASASADGVVRLSALAASPAAPTPLGELRAVEVATPLFALALSPDRRLLSVGGGGGTSLWDVSTPTSPRRVATLTGEEQVLESLQFSPDGQHLVGGTATAVLLRWDLRDSANPVALAPLPQPGGGRTVVAFSPDGRLLATGGRESSLRIWDATDVAALARPRHEVAPNGSAKHFLGLAFSPDSRTLAAATTGRTVERWLVTDPSAPQAQAPLTGFTNYVNDVAYSSDGTMLAAGSSDDTTRTWQTGTDQLLETLPGPAVITSVQFSPGWPGQGDVSLVTSDVDGTTRVWPIPGPVLPGARDTVFVNPVSADGATVLVGTGGSDPSLHLWDLRDPQHARRLPDLTPAAGTRLSGAAALSRDGTLAAGGTSSGGVWFWDLTDRERPQPVGPPVQAVEGLVGVVTLSPDGRLAAVAAQDGRVVNVYDLTDRGNIRLASALSTTNYPQALAFSPSGRLVAAATADNAVTLWDVGNPASPREVSTVSGFSGTAQAVAFSADGTTLAAGSADRTIRLWNVAEPERPRELARISELTGAVYSLAFSSTGHRLAAGLGGGALWVWDTTQPAQPTQHAVLTAYPGRVNDAQFGRDDATVAGSGPDKVVRLWHTAPASAAEQVCRSGGAAITEQEWQRYLPGVPYERLCS
ncbi:helix-turn-helix domain-containing protein [Rhodococcus sp. X156]|uniref:nSTAND1 domain-containing NTPase n=1 Tax=Rhodococcus sp. X156 TaxID=2499145 RepID=UPI000FD7FF3A|nr:helix-turn-helix domain-containing protein [Rhodococcus sp. X156]